MKVNTNRTQLEDNILFTIKDIIMTNDIDSKVILEKVADELYSKNILTAHMILSGSKTLDTLSIQELYHVGKALYKESQKEVINPERYFTIHEIKEMDKFKKEIINTIDVVEFKDFRQVNYDQWSGVTGIKKIVELVNYGKIDYNFATQREPIIKESESGDLIIMKPKTYESSVDSIYELLENNNYIPDCITLNILKTGEEEFEYKNNNIIINKGEIDNLDGWHRIRAFLRYVSLHPDTERNTEVRITHFDENKANRFLNQINKQTPIDVTHLSSRDITNHENNVIRRINEESDMKGLIATNSSAVRQHKALIGFDDICKMIKLIFEIKNSREERLISDYLVEFFNEVYGIFFDEFENITKSKKNNFKLQRLTFIVYLVVAKQLYKLDNWKTQLEIVLNKIDFSLNNEEFKIMLRKERKISNVIISDVENYLKIL